MTSKLYSVSELTTILKLHPKTILRFIKEGKIPATKIGRSWRVSEENLKRYCHDELSGTDPGTRDVDYQGLADRISVSAVIEIQEQHSEEATRISNTLIAILNSESGTHPRARFDFFYYPETEKARYVVYGTPDFISGILDVFRQLCKIGE